MSAALRFRPTLRATLWANYVTVDLLCTVLMSDINQIRRGLHTNVSFIKCTVANEMFCLKCVFRRPRPTELAVRGLEAVRAGAVWTEMSREPQVCKITMTRHDTAWLIKHNSRLVGPRASPEQWAGTAGTEEHLYVWAPNRWQGGPLPVCVRMDVSYSMYVSGCTWLSEGPISCSRLRKVPQNTEIQIVSLWWCHRLVFSARISQKRASVSCSQCRVGLHVHNFTLFSCFTGLREEAPI